MAIIAKEVIISQLESAEEYPIALSDVWEWLGYSKKENALQSFRGLGMAESIDFIQLLIDQEKSIKPLTEIKMTIDCFKLWAMSAQTAKGKEVRLYYIQVEKEWKASQAEVPQLSVDQFQSFKHEFETFRPWATEYPVAASIFLERQGVTPIESQSLPPADAIAALDGAFLNLNRSGLMMNKLFKFLDRVPTMKTLDETFVNELVESLSQAESLVKKAEGDLKAKTNEYDRLGRENKYLVTQNDLLHSQVDALKNEVNALKLQLPIPVKVAKTKTGAKTGAKTYKRPKAKELPPKPLRYALPPGS